MSRMMISTLLGLFTATTFALPPPLPCDTCYKFPLFMKWNYILSEPPKLNEGAQVYDIDMFDTSANKVEEIHALGRKAICYISAGTWEDWRPDADQFPDSVKGNGNGWPGERWLDIRKTDILGPIIEARLQKCKAKGFDAVEFDNVDGYSNDNGFNLTYEDQLNYNAFLANAAHANGLSVGLKNDLDQVDRLQPYFDFAINEQCFQYRECSTLKPFINAVKPVFNVEYRLELTQFCERAKTLRFNSIKKSKSLTNKVTYCP